MTSQLLREMAIEDFEEGRVGQSRVAGPASLAGMRPIMVVQVWNAVDNQGRKEHTSIIHGKYSHEETIATASFAATYLIVRDLEEAEYVVQYILHGGDKQEFLAKFSKAISKVCRPGSRPRSSASHLPCLQAALCLQL